MAVLDSGLLRPGTRPGVTRPGTRPGVTESLEGLGSLVVESSQV